MIDQVIKAIAEVRDVPAEQILPDSTFDSLEIDSLDAMQLLFVLEDQHGIDLSPEEVSPEMTVRELTAYLERVLTEKKSSSPPQSRQ